MPVASSQREAQLCRYRHILPKPPGFHGGQISPTLMMNPDTGYLPEMDQIASIASSSQEATEQNFSTNSPPILNLSPNLSPAEPQRTSPFYDLRESTRRRSAQGLFNVFNTIYVYVCYLYRHTCKTSGP